MRWSLQLVLRKTTPRNLSALRQVRLTAVAWTMRERVLVKMRKPQTCAKKLFRKAGHTHTLSRVCNWV